MYPMTLAFTDYMECQPLRMLLQQKKIIIKSLKHKPNGKLYVTKKLRPPKQMVNKWFFQDMFSSKPLVLIKAAACDLLQPSLGPSGGNELITLTCINIHQVYLAGNWGITQQQGYTPVHTYTEKKVKVFQGSTETELTIGSSGVGYSDGWFQKKILTASKITFNTTDPKYPIYKARYNPKQDTGEGNVVYLCSTATDNYNRPTHDKMLIAQGQPLWLLLFGFADFVKQFRKPAETFPIYYLMITSDSIHPFPKSPPMKTHLIIDESFTKGFAPYGTQIQDYMLTKWYPTLDYQQESISNIVKTGPFVPKPDPTKANWELHYKCIFYFKWGGSLQQDSQILDPSNKKEYDVPDKLQSAIQISDPQTQIPETILHNWDFRRGFITPKALKRMSEHLKAESIISTDADSTPTKRPRLHAQEPVLQGQKTQEETCLHSLFEESIFQDPEKETETSIKQLIKQQHQQQQGIKLKLLQLLTHMKRQQQQLQLQAGLPE